MMKKYYSTDQSNTDDVDCLSMVIAAQDTMEAVKEVVAHEHSLLDSRGMGDSCSASPMSVQS